MFNKNNQEVKINARFGNYYSSYSSDGTIKKKDLYNYLLECSNKLANGDLIISFIDDKLITITDLKTLKSDQVEEKLYNITNLIRNYINKNE